MDVDNRPASGLNNHWAHDNPTFPVLTGAAGIFGAWGTGYIPHTTILDPQGVVRGNWVGWSSSAGNAMHSVIQAWLPAPAEPEVAALHFSGDANNDAHPDPGELLQLELVLANPAGLQGAQNLSCNLETAGPWLTVTQAQTFADQLPGGGQTACAPLLVLQVDPASPRHTAQLQFSWSATGAQGEALSGSFSAPLDVARHPLLVVDRDPAYDEAGPVIAALDQLGLAYDLWTGGCADQPSDSLKSWNTVLWLGGRQFPALDEADLFQARLHVSQGRRFFLSAQHLPSAAADLAEIFAIQEGAFAPGPILSGVPGSPFENGFCQLNTPGGAQNSIHPNELLLLEGAESLFDWAPGPGAALAGRRDATGRALCAAFPLEAVGTQIEGWVTIPELLSECLAWLDQPQELPAPHLEIQRLADGSLRLQWNSIPGAAGYHVWTGTHPFQVGSLLDTTPDTTYTLPAPSAGMAGYRVEASID